jgi:hypothetical protein
MGYERTLLPRDFGDIDLFSVHADTPGLFLHRLRDTPRQPILTIEGDYELFFKLYSQSHPTQASSRIISGPFNHLTFYLCGKRSGSSGKSGGGIYIEGQFTTENTCMI